MKTISKSKYLSGLQCHKLFWHYYNAKALIPPPDQSTLHLFQQGHDVGALAKRLFPDGIEIGKGMINPSAVSRLSQAALIQRKPMFEAGFFHQIAFARADILAPVEGNLWDIVEVKSSTEVKDVNIHDLAFQRYVYEGAGLRIRRCILLLINNQYIRNGEIDIDQIFLREDVTDRVNEIFAGVPDRVQRLIPIIAREDCPEIEIGPQCHEPYLCPLKDHCWNFLPEHNVLSLYRMKKEKGFELIHNGICGILDLPADYEFSEKQQIQSDTLRTNTPKIDRDALCGFLDRLAYPLYFLDFETFSTAIPIFDGSCPYQNIPFQYSLHVIGATDEPPVHHGFLADGKTDPRPELMEKLQRLLGSSGSIIAYNASFEKNALKGVCETFGEYEGWYQSIEPRFLDLLEPFRSFAWYHPDQCGSASLKAVLPALTGRNYDHLEISEGGTASNEYLRVTFGRVEETERQRVRKNLEDYCRMDTEGMVDIINRLEALV